MNKLINDNLVEALQNQLGHEKYNANLYLFLAGGLKNKGFDNLAAKFLTQHEEETEHSLIIFNLLTDLNAPIIIPDIDAVNLSLISIVEIAQRYLDREILTTQSLGEIRNLAMDEGNFVVEERMREMIKLQQNEYEEATTFMDKAELCGNDWFKVMLWDLGEK